VVSNPDMGYLNVTGSRVVGDVDEETIPALSTEKKLDEQEPELAFDQRTEPGASQQAPRGLGPTRTSGRG